MRLPEPYALAQAGARAIAWLTAFTAIVVLAFVGNCWPGSGQAIIAGLIGSAMAMLNDSWEVAAIMDSSPAGFPRLTTGRRVLHDLFSLAICIGGIIMMWVSSVNFGDPVPKTDDERKKERFILAGLWTVFAVV
ncbi:Fc.00g106780.m01.CDS01 [Cosmosporella sp. VM-42]